MAITTTSNLHTMLSYDAPLSVNGNAPSSPTVISTPLPSVAPIAKQPVIAVKPMGVNVSNPAAPVLDAANKTANKYHHIWLVTGPAGCGKSTVAQFLSKALNFPYIEGDEFHPPSNIEKMSNGIPLTDADRWDWLTALREESLRQIDAGSEGVVLTCSALKRKYRDVIRVAGYFDHSLHIHFIYLQASESILLSRVQARQNHYMPASMVHSQLHILEPPTDSEKDVIKVDVTRPVEEVTQDVLARVLATLTDEK